MRPTFKKCPTCGSRQIKLIEGDFLTTANGKRVVVSNLRRHECPSCGEILLDYEAVKQIEDRRKVAKRKPKKSLHPLRAKAKSRA